MISTLHTADNWNNKQTNGCGKEGN